jgi:type III secretion protein V
VLIVAAVVAPVALNLRQRQQALAAQAAGKKGPAAEASESDDIQPSYTVPMAIVTSTGLAPYMSWHPALPRSFRPARSSVKG